MRVCGGGLEGRLSSVWKVAYAPTLSAPNATPHPPTPTHIHTHTPSTPTRTPTPTHTPPPISHIPREAQAKSEEINAQEKILGMITTSFQNIGAAISRLEPFLILWTTSHQFFESYNKWTNNHEITFGALDPEEIENEVLECTRKIDKLTKVFSGSAGGRVSGVGVGGCEWVGAEGGWWVERVSGGRG